MNRRNFLLGIGTLVTMSGAASTVGAALSNTVNTSFGGIKIVNQSELNVNRNEALTEQNVLTSNDNFTNTSVNFSRVGQDSPVEYSDFPELFVNNKSDGDLTIELATGDDPTTPYNNNLTQGGTEPYNGSEPYGYAPLVIENKGNAKKDVSMEYTYGNDVTDSSTDLSKSQTAEVYRFSIGTTQISPAAASPDSQGNITSIDAGDSKYVDLNVQLSSNTAEDVRAASTVSGTYNFNQEARAETNMLDAAVFKTGD